MGEKDESAVQGEVSLSSATLDILSPKKFIVESATMIYIIAFILFSDFIWLFYRYLVVFFWFSQCFSFLTCIHI